jgi:hypothetical protein
MINDQGGVFGVGIFDLTRDSARKWYATAMSTVLNAANFSTAQWDGFETNLLLAGSDMPHSKNTFNSGMYRGAPSPDWYHLGYPTYWGMGVIKAMEDTHALFKHNTAVECSFMAPGLGPYRPDMAPYVDQDISKGIIALGLEWHPKMLQRTAMSGVVINPYGTWWWYPGNPYNVNFTLADVDYWMGGLIAGGVTPQVGGWSDNATLVNAMGGWFRRYKKYGHMTEDGIRSLYYDHRCNHVNGISEWIACDDIVLSILADGQLGGPVAGLYVGSTRLVELEPQWAPNSTTLVVFGAVNVTDANVDLGVPADTHLNVDFVSAGIQLKMGGGFWQLKDQNVVACVHRRSNNEPVCKSAFSRSSTGQMAFEMRGAIGDQWSFSKVPGTLPRLNNPAQATPSSFSLPITLTLSLPRSSSSPLLLSPPPPPPPPPLSPSGFAALLLGEHDPRGIVHRPINFTLTRPNALWERAHSAGFFEYEQTYTDYGSYVLQTHYVDGRCATSSTCNPQAVGQTAGCQGLDCSGSIKHTPNGSVVVPHTVPLLPNRKYILAAVVRTNFSRFTTELFMNIFLIDTNGLKLNSTLAGGGLPITVGSGTVDGWMRFEWEFVSPVYPNLAGGALGFSFVFGCGNLLPTLAVADFALVETPPVPLMPFAIGEGVTFAGGAGALPMRVVSCSTDAVVTTAARYEFMQNGSMSMSQLIDFPRMLGVWHAVPALVLTDLRVISASDDHCILGNKDITIGIQGDSLLGFVPHVQTNITVTSVYDGSFNRLTWGHLLSEDDFGGFTVSPYPPSGSGRMPRWCGASCCMHDFCTQELLAALTAWCW